MRLSRYCKIFQDKINSDSVLLFSTRNASKLSIPKNLLKEIESDKLSKEEKNTLTELGFLAKSHEHEKNELLGLMDELNSTNKTFKAIVVMNLDCNLACKYCFEGTRKGKFYMSRETADEFVEFVRNNITSGGLDKINLIFYGGEPLLSIGHIIYISEKLETLCETEGTEYSFSLITNGTLLSPGIAERLKSLGLKSASVTLDGPREVHDIFRPYKTGKRSFDNIFKNVKNVCDIIDIQIGGNFTKDNYMQFPLLLDYLYEEGLSPDKISTVRFDPVINEGEGIMPPDFHDGCNSSDEPWLLEAGLFLREEIIKRGYNTPKITPGICMMELRDNMLINYNGDIYKCPGMISREEYKVGDIRTGVRDYRQSHYLDNWKNEKCLNCEYLPLCFGGCRYMKLVRDGNMDGIDCKKPYLDAALEALVKQDIKYS
ncbi:MAG: putative geopeptide radical SAM maturase [Nitrospirae bacterium GWC2_42_7]|nr:MAG: putative geopeptide radical SAM maturase [Nitrospirae bacterium GWC2_42_7]